MLKIWIQSYKSDKYMWIFPFLSFIQKTKEESKTHPRISSRPSLGKCSSSCSFSTSFGDLRASFGDTFSRQRSDHSFINSSSTRKNTQLGPRTPLLFFLLNFKCVIFLHLCPSVLPVSLSVFRLFDRLIQSVKESLLLPVSSHLIAGLHSFCWNWYDVCQKDSVKLKHRISSF